MGMPMNRFAMLKKLRDDIKSGDYNSRQFKLSAVIVHDPNDRELVDCIQKNFVKWAELTGEHFLFITFVPPSLNWRREYRETPCYVDERYLVTDVHYTYEDEKNTMLSLRDFMALPEDGSYLMLTSDLAGEDFHSVRITAESVEKCLTRITRYCEEGASGTGHLPGDFKTLLKEINAEDYKLSCSLIDVLLDITSLVSHVSRSSFDYDEQKERAESVIRRVKEQLRCAEGKDYEEKLFLLCMNMETMFRNLQISKAPSRQELERDYRYGPFLLDEDSMKLLNTYYILKDALKDKDYIDYSCLTMCLGKIVENEANLSICQMLRYVMGIDMPAYYNIYCEDVEGVTIPAGDRYVDINRYRHTEYRRGPIHLESVPLGNLAYAYAEMSCRPHVDPEPIWERFVDDEGELIPFLMEFSRRYRNLAAHLDSDSEGTYNGAEDAFRRFMNRHLPELSCMKQWLSRRSFPMR